MNRRGFLGAILAAGAAPAFAGSGVLMPVRQILSPLPVLWGDGVHDDTEGLQALIDGRPLRNMTGASRSPMGEVVLSQQILRVSSTIVIGTGVNLVGRNTHFGWSGVDSVIRVQGDGVVNMSGCVFEREEGVSDPASALIKVEAPEQRFTVAPAAKNLPKGPLRASGAWWRKP